jgi:bifunctional UDP-N-acetylglucosamine pyrophosphorylase/glucosamine-1-phosphate N-acetyltransferase
MQAVILAAGQGKRLQPLTLNTPKAMIPINGTPMLEIILRQLKSVGVTEAVIVVHYLKEKITGYFGDGSKLGMRIKYAEQKEMKGSADAVLCAAPFITDERFLCIACDVLFDTAHLQSILAVETQGALSVHEVSDARRFGVIMHEGTRVTRIVEKSENPPTNLANASVYLFPREIFAACASIKPGINGENWITDAIQKLITSGTDFSFVNVKNWLDIGTPEQYAEAQVLARKLKL